MILRIGNKAFTPLDRRSRVNSNRRHLMGFTLIEVMAATVVLSLGIVLIYEAFFISLDAFNYYRNYLDVSPWINEKIWQAQNNLMRFNIMDSATAGEFLLRNKNFKWSLSYGLINKAGRLYKIDLVVHWQEGRRNIKLLRTAYATYEERK